MQQILMEADDEALIGAGTRCRLTQF